MRLELFDAIRPRMSSFVEAPRRTRKPAPADAPCGIALIWTIAGKAQRTRRVASMVVLRPSFQLVGSGFVARSHVFASLGDLGRAEAVTARLTDAISMGLLADGEQLPSEAELAAQFGVATVTVREALVALRQQGLVATRRGRGGGSFVIAPDEGAPCPTSPRSRPPPTG